MQHVRRILRHEDRLGVFQEVDEIPLELPVNVLTVSQLTSRIRDCIYRQFRDVIVEGEISNFKIYPSGHLYFTLKDDSCSMKAVMFNYEGKCRVDVIKDGTAVICKGRIDVYEKRGEYRLLADGDRGERPGAAADQVRDAQGEALPRGTLRRGR